MSGQLSSWRTVVVQIGETVQHVVACPVGTTLTVRVDTTVDADDWPTELGCRLLDDAGVQVAQARSVPGARNSEDLVCRASIG
ncbi:hypothetical protein AD006_29485 (plasmid) [Pseudonocardia sp. EC080610-09]|nr:hypothetical protein AD006_29485 [Pseudonocardia sp. EC080610-09]ALL85641.1 hypothetical protein AD017_31765 [Pseudonocardia sp. EC080619-01]